MKLSFLILFFFTCYAMEDVSSPKKCKLAASTCSYLYVFPSEIWIRILEYLPGNHMLIHELMYKKKLINKTQSQDAVFPMTTIIADAIVNQLKQKNSLKLFHHAWGIKFEDCTKKWNFPPKTVTIPGNSMIDYSKIETELKKYMLALSTMYSSAPNGYRYFETIHICLILERKNT